jgi:hypothetical protein
VPTGIGFVLHIRPGSRLAQRPQIGFVSHTLRVPRPSRSLRVSSGRNQNPLAQRRGGAVLRGQRTPMILRTQRPCASARDIIPFVLRIYSIYPSQRKLALFRTRAPAADGARIRPRDRRLALFCTIGLRASRLVAGRNLRHVLWVPRPIPAFAGMTVTPARAGGNLSVSCGRQAVDVPLPI